MAVPVTLVDARRQLKLEADDTSQDDELTGFIADAAGWVENYTGHILAARDVTVQLPSFASKLPVWPIKSGAAVSVSYGRIGAAPTVITGANVAVGSRPARLAIPTALSAWPLLSSSDVITVTVRAGYEAGDDVPANFRRAMLVLIGGYDADREGGDTFAKAEASARRLLAFYRARSL